MAYQGTSLLHFSHQRDQAGWCLKQYDGGMCALHCHQMYGSIYTLSTGWWSKTWTALNGQIGAPTYWWPIPPFSQVILLHQTMNIIIYFLLLASGSKKKHFWSVIKCVFRCRHCLERVYTLGCRSTNLEAYSARFCDQTCWFHAPSSSCSPNFQGWSHSLLINCWFCKCFQTFASFKTQCYYLWLVLFMKIFVI